MLEKINKRLISIEVGIKELMQDNNVKSYLALLSLNEVTPFPYVKAEIEKFKQDVVCIRYSELILLREALLRQYDKIDETYS